ncbi:MAG: toast rack family protein [Candidatus Marinimicrobia bacterium]|nr:toast rack family protein [Candidatus Neomarinimicrobiota bacterium]
MDTKHQKNHVSPTRVVFPLLLFFGMLLASDAQTVRHDIPLKGEKQLDVEIEFGLGRLFLKSLPDNNFVMKSQMTYYDKELKPNLEYKILGSRGRLHLYTNDKGKDKHFNFRHEKDSYNDSKRSVWELGFNKNIPTAFDIEMGLGDGEMDFTDIRVTDLSLECGLSDVNVEFNKRNKEEVKNINIETGLGNVTVRGLGLLNMERFDVECGLGSTILEFNGDLLRDAKGRISVGLGSVSVEMPDNVGVEIQAENSFLSSLNLRGFDRIDNDIYRSGNWKTAKKRVYITVEVGLGSVDFDWID